MQSDPPILQYVSRQDDHLQSRKRRALRFGAEHLLILGAAVLSVAFFAGMFLLFHASVFSGIVGALTGILLIPLVAAFVRSRQRLSGLRILNYLEQSVRLRLPLPEFLRVAAENESRRPARQLRTISESLGLGISLGDAVLSEVPELSPRVGSLLRAAEANGTIPAALSRLTREAEAKARQAAERSSSMPLTYVAVLIVFFVAAIGFVAIFVLPKIIMITRDFGMPFTPLERLARWLDSPAVGFSVLVVLALAVITVLGSIVSSAKTFMGRMTRRYDPLRPLRDRLLWHLPWVGSLRRDNDYADVCQTLADAFFANRNADTSLQEVLQPHLNLVLARRVERWHLLHLRGQSLGRAAQTAGMPSLLHGMLPEHATSETLAATFEFLARHYRSRALRAHHWLLSLLSTAVTCLFGAIVLGFSYLLYTSVWRLTDMVIPYKVGL